MSEMWSSPPHGLGIVQDPNVSLESHVESESTSISTINSERSGFPDVNSVVPVRVSQFTDRIEKQRIAISTHAVLIFRSIEFPQICGSLKA
jgi:hypothetical protein